MSDKEPLYHVRRAIQVAEKEGLDDEKVVLEQVHNEIVEERRAAQDRLRSVDVGTRDGGVDD